MPAHGGDLHRARALYPDVEEPWIDLSTGINPQPYPLPPLPAVLWSALPEPDAALLAAARDYYRAPRLLAVPGSQAAIHLLPALIEPAAVLMPAVQYAEHAHQWRLAGHSVTEAAADELESRLASHRWLVLCNPSNPTGERWPREQLLDWAARLAARGGGLVVDEAFADPYPGLSVADAVDRGGLIVLRSFGKFFGLAGARVGFVAAGAELLARLETRLGPWAVSGPAQTLARIALSDRDWQRAAAHGLAAGEGRLTRLLAAAGIASGGTCLFRSWLDADAPALQAFLARRGIWIRIFDDGRVRLGLPPDEDAWRRLGGALHDWTAQRAAERG